MNSKTLAIIGYLVFMAVFVYGIFEIQHAIRRQSSFCSCPQVSRASVPSYSHLLYSIYAELSQKNALDLAVLKKEHPALEKELLYIAFTGDIARRRSVGPFFKFKPLSKEYKTHFDYLKKRYQEENPDDVFKID